MPIIANIFVMCKIVVHVSIKSRNVNDTAHSPEVGEGALTEDDNALSEAGLLFRPSHDSSRNVYSNVSMNRFFSSVLTGTPTALADTTIH